MLVRFVCCGGLLGAAVAVAAGGTVWVNLDSPVNTATIAPGTVVNWSIKFGVSLDDNRGLSLLVCDLVQDPNNPARFDIPYADPASIPEIMAGFNRPGGITNVGENGAASGFIGLQRGPVGQKNLVQIGGAQNTFAVPGVDSGTDVIVDTGIGQSGLQTLVSGSFAAPATPGAYHFYLTNAVANVLVLVPDASQGPPTPSAVAIANVELGGAHLRFTVAPGYPVGDLNCTGAVGFEDINAFVLALTNAEGYATQYPNCDRMLADCNGDGAVGFEDINAFVALLSGKPG